MPIIFNQYVIQRKIVLESGETENQEFSINLSNIGILFDDKTDAKKHQLTFNPIWHGLYKKGK